MDLDLERAQCKECPARLIDEPAGAQTKEAAADWSRRHEFQFVPYCGAQPDGCQEEERQSSLDGSSGAGPPSAKPLASPADSSESMELAAKTDSRHLCSEPAPPAATAPPNRDNLCELRLLVRRREAGALIGKRGSNIKRLRDSYRGSMLSIPDTGNGPERIACILADHQSMAHILADLSELLLEKSAENDDQIELKLLIHSSQAGSIIGVGGQSIKKLRNESKAAIKIYELCCPYSNERVCAIKAKPPVVVSTIQLLQAILGDNPAKGPLKPYDASHFDPMLCEKYGGYLPDEPLELLSGPAGFESAAAMHAYSRLTEAAALQSTLHLAHQHHQHQQQLAAVIDQTNRHNHYHRMLYQQQQARAAADLGADQASRARKSGSAVDAGPLPAAGSEPTDSQQSKPAAKAPATRQARFHPYAGEPHIPSIHQVARLAPYERFIRLQPALFQHQPPFGTLSQTAASNRCRHLRPCLCMLMGPATAAHRGLQPFAANLINYTPSARLPATTTKDAGCFGPKKK